MKFIPWTKDVAKKELQKRLKNAMEGRKPLEHGWAVAEKAVFLVEGIDDAAAGARLLSGTTLAHPEDQERTKLSINRTFKNYRFLHSQLSANPPTVICRPTSSDLDDRRKADAADRLVRYAIRSYKLQEYMDLCSAQTLLYGTGFIKTRWDVEGGDMLEFDREKMEVIMEGDIDVSVPLTWNIFIDPDAETWEKVRYVFERMYVPFDEALSRWPEHAETFKRLQKKGQQSKSGEDATSAMLTQKYDVVEIFEYWEKGLPQNGMQGRFCFCLPDGTPLGEVEENPHSFSVEKDDKGYFITDSDLTQAELPYGIFTDVDNIGTPWGKATALYQIPLQDVHNAVLSSFVDNVRAHGVARIVLPDGTELADDSMTNVATDIIRTTGKRDPTYMAPMQLPTSMAELMAFTSQGVDDMAGVNESMFGQQSREQSGFSMQYATNQGNMIRRRLFNKYVMAVETTFKTFLNLVRKHWTIKRRIHVLGNEKAFEALDLQGADISGGFDLVVEYGASLSLDPTSRRQEILTLMPLFEKYGVDGGTIMSMLKLNELENLYDMTAKGRERQSEIFIKMIQTGKYEAPEKMRDHKSMLAYAYDFLMSAEFRDLQPNLKSLIEKHVAAREKLAAEGVAAGQQVGAAGAPAPGGAAPAGAMPATAGGAQAQVTQLPQIANG